MSALDDVLGGNIHWRNVKSGTSGVSWLADTVRRYKIKVKHTELQLHSCLSMSLNSRIQCNEMNRLQSTAVTFTPLDSQSNDTLPFDGQQPDTNTPDGSDPSHVVSEVSVHVAYHKPELTHSKTDTDCTFCASLGRVLDCCKAQTNPRP